MLKNLLMWFLLKIQKPLLANPNAKYAILIHELELGDLQVFHLLKETERSMEKNIIPYEVYWQSKSKRIVYGPFVNIHSAMSHYTMSIALPNSIVMNKPEGPPTKAGTLIEVDFKGRKRK